MDKIGVQIFGLQKECTTDLIGTLRAIQQIGFSLVEPLVVFRPTQEQMPMNIWAEETFLAAQKEIQSLGMDIDTIHVGIGFGDMIMPAATEIAEKMIAFYHKTGVLKYVVSGMFEDEAGAKKWATLLSEIVERVEQYGCSIVYHNHEIEFTSINNQGQTALDYFFEQTSQKVMLQLDIGWAGFISANEVEVAQKYADRIVSLHMKDFHPIIRHSTISRDQITSEIFAPIGVGCIKTEDIVKLRSTFKNFNGSLIIDQDMSSGTMLQDIKIGYDNLLKMIK